MSKAQYVIGKSVGDKIHYYTEGTFDESLSESYKWDSVRDVKQYFKGCDADMSKWRIYEVHLEVIDVGVFTK